LSGAMQDATKLSSSFGYGFLAISADHGVTAMVRNSTKELGSNALVQPDRTITDGAEKTTSSTDPLIGISIIKKCVSRIAASSYRPRGTDPGTDHMGTVVDDEKVKSRKHNRNSALSTVSNDPANDSTGATMFSIDETITNPDLISSDTDSKNDEQKYASVNGKFTDQFITIDGSVFEKSTSRVPNIIIEEMPCSNAATNVNEPGEPISTDITITTETIDPEINGTSSDSTTFNPSDQLSLSGAFESTQVADVSADDINSTHDQPAHTDLPVETTGEIGMKSSELNAHKITSGKHDSSVTESNANKNGSIASIGKLDDSLNSGAADSIQMTGTAASDLSFTYDRQEMTEIDSSGVSGITKSPNLNDHVTDKTIDKVLEEETSMRDDTDNTRASRKNNRGGSVVINHQIRDRLNVSDSALDTSEVTDSTVTGMEKSQPSIAIRYAHETTRASSQNSGKILTTVMSSDDSSLGESKISNSDETSQIIATEDISYTTGTTDDMLISRSSMSTDMSAISAKRSANIIPYSKGSGRLRPAKIAGNNENHHVAHSFTTSSERLSVNIKTNSPVALSDTRSEKLIRSESDETVTSPHLIATVSEGVVRDLSKFDSTLDASYTTPPAFATISRFREIGGGSENHNVIDYSGSGTLIPKEDASSGLETKEGGEDHAEIEGMPVASGITSTDLRKSAYETEKTSSSTNESTFIPQTDAMPSSVDEVSYHSSFYSESSTAESSGYSSQSDGEVTPSVSINAVGKNSHKVNVGNIIRPVQKSELNLRTDSSMNARISDSVGNALSTSSTAESQSVRSQYSTTTHSSPITSTSFRHIKTLSSLLASYRSSRPSVRQLETSLYSSVNIDRESERSEMKSSHTTLIPTISPSRFAVPAQSAEKIHLGKTGSRSISRSENQNVHRASIINKTLSTRSLKQATAAHKHQNLPHATSDTMDPSSDESQEVRPLKPVHGNEKTFITKDHSAAEMSVTANPPTGSRSAHSIAPSNQFIPTHFITTEYSNASETESTESVESVSISQPRHFATSLTERFHFHDCASSHTPSSSLVTSSERTAHSRNSKNKKTSKAVGEKSDKDKASSRPVNVRSIPHPRFPKTSAIREVTPELTSHDVSLLPNQSGRKSREISPDGKGSKQLTTHERTTPPQKWNNNSDHHTSHVLVPMLTTGPNTHCPQPTVNLSHASLPLSSDKHLVGEQPVGTEIIHVCANNYIFPLSQQPVNVYICLETGHWTSNMRGESCECRLHSSTEERRLIVPGEEEEA
uniref:Dentin sialophosphoprotein-like n=1 Tax=Anisakis simplex TaxID=6269 RepID=A0A0M3IZS7_ANISI